MIEKYETMMGRICIPMGEELKIMIPEKSHVSYLSLQ